MKTKHNHKHRIKKKTKMKVRAGQYKVLNETWGWAVPGITQLESVHEAQNYDSAVAAVTNAISSLGTPGPVRLGYVGTPIYAGSNTFHINLQFAKYSSTSGEWSAPISAHVIHTLFCRGTDEAFYGGDIDGWMCRIQQ